MKRSMRLVSQYADSFVMDTNELNHNIIGIRVALRTPVGIILKKLTSEAHHLVIKVYCVRCFKSYAVKSPLRSVVSAIAFIVLG
ncbi:hypothetical protein J2T15_001163 [Paenibacillus harenae]|uniref:Uncharacterized protein n=1 Tax=Paenibacillus harenae TaxID=306543 RepID=A0ABT9TZ52_PAEHA|nr:hypothetical protein [Paenibacillus harenae]